MKPQSFVTAAATAVAFLALAQYAQATIAVSYPIASTTCTGGKPCGPFTWEIDDSVLPVGADFGETTVGIYVGSVNVQALFYNLKSISNPTKLSSIPAVTIPAKQGPDGDFYFLRFQSVKGVDNTTGYPLQAFSAKFSLTGMTGKLSATQSAAVAASSTTATATNTNIVTPTASSTPAPIKAADINSNSATSSIATNNGALSVNVHGGIHSVMIAASLLAMSAWLAL